MVIPPAPTLPHTLKRTNFLIRPWIHFFAMHDLPLQRKAQKLMQPGTMFKSAFIAFHVANKIFCISIKYFVPIQIIPGLSCELCTDGTQKQTINGSMYETCKACDCDGRTETFPPQCTPSDGVCLNCRNGTTGSHCELCSEHVTGSECDTCEDTFWGLGTEGCKCKKNVQLQKMSYKYSY